MSQSELGPTWPACDRGWPGRLNGIGPSPPAPADLAEERKRARFLAERYGGLLLFLVDHQNEPALGLADTPQQNAWFTRFVERKYKEAPPYTKVTSGEISSAWGDLRSYDLKVAASEEMARWARVLSEEMRAYQGRNRLSLRRRGAKAAAVDEQGRPVAVVHALGQGRVVFTADPLEVEEAVLAGSALYPAFLALAGVPGHEISPGESPLHCFEVPTRQGTAWVVYDRRPPAGHDPFHVGLPKPFRPEDTTSVTLKKADLSLALAPMKPGFAHLSSGGDLLAVEAQGRVSRKGVPVLETDTHAIVIVLDGRNLRRSDHLLVMGYYPGSIRVTSDVRNLRAGLGELREGRWATLSEIALGRTPEAVALDLDEGTALEMVLLSTDPPQAARYLRGLAGFGDPVKPK